MSDYTRVIDKAIAELVIAKGQQPQYAKAALTQARYHINLALDDAQRQDPPLQIGTTTPGPHPGLF